MRKGDVILVRCRVLAALLPMAILFCFGGGPAWGAGLATGFYTLDWDSKVDKKDAGAIETWTMRQTAGIGYRGLLSPIILNEVTLKVEQERDQTGKDLIRVTPTITLGYKGTYWNAGAKRNVEESNEPDKNALVTDSYFVELFLAPPRTSFPDLKAKYSLDQDYQKDTSDTSKHSFLASSVYSPMEWIRFQGDYDMNRTYDYQRADADSRSDKWSVLSGVRFTLSDKVKFNSEYRVEQAVGWTNLDAGGRTNEKDDTDQTWKNVLSFRPFATTTFDASYDYELKQNKVTGESDRTTGFKVGASQTITPFVVRADFNRTITDTMNTADANSKTDDTLTAEAVVKLTQLFYFSARYQDKTTDQRFFSNPSKNLNTASKIYSASWAGDLTTFWKATASFDRTDSFKDDVKTTIDKKLSFRSPFDIKAINLLLEPTYDITYREDLQKVPTEESEIRDFRFNFAYKIFPTQNIAAALTHIYGRKTDSLANNITRTDDTKGNITLVAPIPGWNFAVDVTRTASDTSGDDLSSDVNSTVSFRGEYRGQNLLFATAYKYDIKTTTSNSETFDAKIGWLAPHWTIDLTYAFNKTFSKELNEGYTISLAFKYNL